MSMLLFLFRGRGPGRVVNRHIRARFAQDIKAMWRGFEEILLEVEVGKQPAQTGLTEDQKTGLNPAAIPVADLARMLGVPEVQLRRHVDEGAPTNADGTVNLVHLAAWLNAPTSNEGTHGA